MLRHIAPASRGFGLLRRLVMHYVLRMRLLQAHGDGVAPKNKCSNRAMQGKVQPLCPSLWPQFKLDQ
ncbi:hypothetical protein HaLaN_31447, partial [Haematococcus lacustris]